jgi:branched-chain amino acid transport system permease protein
LRSAIRPSSAAADDSSIGVIAQRAYIYWIPVGRQIRGRFAGQIAIGWVSMLTLGAYTTAVSDGRHGDAGPASHLALVAGGAVGARPASSWTPRPMHTFYFAMTTGPPPCHPGGARLKETLPAVASARPAGFPWPFDPGWGFRYFCFIRPHWRPG